MSVEFERIQKARRLVTSVLRREVTRENSPAVFEEDLLYLGVRTLELDDSEWLIRELSAPESTPEGQRELALVISPSIRQKAGIPAPSTGFFRE